MKKVRKKSTLRSGFEDKVVADLRSRGLLFSYEAVKLKYVLPEATYTPDIVLPNGIIVELKGYFRSESRRILLAVRKSHPKLDIRLVFQKLDSKVQGSKTMTCEAWATKYSFKYAETTIPDAWYEYPEEVEDTPFDNRTGPNE
jgi:hypothetical protein